MDRVKIPFLVMIDNFGIPIEKLPIIFIYEGNKLWHIDPMICPKADFPTIIPF